MLATFCRQPSLDRRLLLSAAALHLFVAVGVRVLSFARVRHALDRLAACDAQARSADDIDARVVWAVRTASARLPGASCLTEALVARCLLMRFQREATLCFGVSRIRPAGRPFDAHAWLERGGSGLIGARAIAYDPFRHPRSVSEKCEHAPSRPAPPAKHGWTSEVLPPEARLLGAREPLLRRAPSRCVSSPSAR